jgi:DNA-binding NarL/FixJ family response regulator
MSEATMNTTTTADDSTQTNLLKLVRHAARTADVATSKRDAAIREARRAGASLRDIAIESGLSHMTVKRIIERSAD